MKQLQINWVKELKNCVPFYVFVNGVEHGLISRGTSVVVSLEQDTAELYFVPKAPKWFGWKALKVQVRLTGETSVLDLGVQVDGFSLLGELGRAANINNQLHCVNGQKIDVLAAEFIKKYK